MEYPKSVIKSKSSNTAITSKYPAKGHGHQSAKSMRPGGRNKKSWSSAEFQGTASKKRGVYVEKKSANALNSRQGASPQDEKRKQLQRETRRDRKKTEKEFLNSIQNILSRDTASTQYPEPRDDLKPGKPRKIIRRVGVETVDKGTQDMDAIYESPNNSPIRNRSAVRRNPPEKRNRSPEQRNRSPEQRNRSPEPRNRSPEKRNKSPEKRNPVQRENRSAIPKAIPRVARPKFRSRVLSENLKPDEKIVVIEPKRQLECSSSFLADNLDESKKTICSTILETPVDQNTVTISQVTHETNANDTSEGKQLKKAKQLRIEEPATLVSEFKSKDSETENKKGLYNFFVDLLETTFSVYNVHADLNTRKSIDSKSNEMVIDDTIVKKLNMPQQLKYDEDFTDTNFQRGNQEVFEIDDKSTDRVEVYKIKPNCANMNPPILKQPRIRSRVFRNNLVSDSYSYNLLYHRSESPKKQAKSIPEKVHKTKNKKKTLLNMLKEELQMDDDAFEEPQTLHQALKIIARNKRRTRRYIHFDDQPPMRPPADGQPDCMFKRRKVISPSTKSTKKNKLFRIYNPQTMFFDSIKTSALPRKFSASNTTFWPKRDDIGQNIHVRDKDAASYHSIEVSAFTYEPDQMVRSTDNKNKTILYAFHSVESLATESISSKDFLGNTKGKRLSRMSTASTSIAQLLADYD